MQTYRWTGQDVQEWPTWLRFKNYAAGAGRMVIHTLTGVLVVYEGDWITHDTKGDLKVGAEAIAAMRKDFFDRHRALITQSGRTGNPVEIPGVEGKVYIRQVIVMEERCSIKYLRPNESEIHEITLTPEFVGPITV